MQNQNGEIEKTPLNLGAAKLVPFATCLLIVNNASPCSDGILLTAPIESGVSAGPIQPSI